MKLDNRWFKDLKDKEERQGVQDRIVNTLNSDPTIKKLVEIVDRELSNLYKTEEDRSNYLDQGWAYQQAHINGQVNALNSIRKLLTNE